MRSNFYKSMWLFALLLLSAQTAFTQLSGSYTIDPKGSGSRNYTSVSAAATALTTSGVNGPVIFDIANGTYSGQVSFSKAISGTSATNNITFRSASKDSSKVIITNASSYTLYFYGADYVTFKQVTITNTYTSTCYNIYMYSNSDYNSFINCHIQAPNSSTTTYNVYCYQSEYNTFTNCYLKGGYYNFYMYGWSTSQYTRGNTIQDCQLMFSYTYGLYQYYASGTVFKNNRVDSMINGSSYGVMSYYSNTCKFISNRIFAGAYGMYMYYNNYNAPFDTTEVYNNMVKAEGGTYAIYSYYTQVTKFMHNAFYCQSTSSYGAYIYYPLGTRWVNNIFQLKGSSYGFYFYAPTGYTPKQFDYNDLYSPGSTYLVYFVSGAYTTLAALKTGQPTYNKNSVSVDPEFESNKSLRTFSPSLNNIGKNVGVTKDVDGNARPNTTDKKIDIGCNDYYLAPYDLDIAALVSPLSVSLSSNTITAQFKNTGSQTISSSAVSFQYSVDSGKTWVTENTTISSLTAGSTYNYSFTKTWTPKRVGKFRIGIRISKSVSGDPDSKDEMFYDICSGLAGTYTIGGAKADYANFKAAVKDLQCGLAGKVVFNVRKGTYNENVYLKKILGASSKNTVTFHSAHVDSVKLTHNATGTSDMNTLVFDNADWVTFENMTIEASNVSYGFAVTFTNRADHNKLLNNKILVNTSAATTNVNAIVFTGSITSYSTYGITGDYNLIEGNQIEGGYYGIRMVGSTTSIPGNGNIIKDNKLVKQYYYGIYCYYQDSIQVIGNSATNFTYTYNYGMMIYYSSNFKVERNYTNSYYYDYLYYGNYYNWNGKTRGSFVNNMIISTGTSYTFYCYYNYYTDIWHNSFYGSGASTSYGWYLYYGKDLDVRNNIFQYNGTSYLLYQASCTFINFDYNDFYYPATSTFCSYDGTICSTLKDLKSLATKYNQHSWDKNPDFISMSDVHLGKKFPSMFGAKVGVTKDFDLDDRCSISPTIGADEVIQSGYAPVADFLVPDTAWLYSSTTLFNSNKPNDASKVRWYVGTTFVSDSFHLEYKFSKVGKQQVSMSIRNCAGYDSVTKTVFVSLSTRKPVADFLASSKTVFTGSSIILSDVSQNGPISWTWTITPVMVYDPFLATTVRTFTYIGKTDSNSANPKIRFDYPGEYAVCLKVENSAGADSLCRNAYIKVNQNFVMCDLIDHTDATRGTIFDDGGPTGQYSSGKTGLSQCSAVISQCKGELQLDIRQFDLANGDYLRIYDGPSKFGKPLYNTSLFPSGFNGKVGDAGIPTSLIATTGSAYFEFESDASTTVGEGFAIEWSVIPTTFKAPKAIISMPDTACVGFPTVFTNATTDPYIDLEWDILNDGKSDGYSESIAYTFNTTGAYQVKLTAIHDCAGRDLVIKTIYIQNAAKAPKPGLVVDKRVAQAGDTVRISDASSYCASGTKWEITPATYTLNNNGSLTDENLEIIFLKAGYYDLKQVKINTFGKDSTTWSKYIQILDYCEPYVLNIESDHGISRVAFNDFDHTSSTGKYGYRDFTETVSTTVETGLKYPITIDRSSNTSLVSIKVWMDLNIDGDFDDAGENVLYLKPSTILSQRDSITIPSSATAGTTRMRVSTSYKNQSNVACGPHQFGEFEDYTIVISDKDLSYPTLFVKGPKVDTIEVFSNWKESGYNATDKRDGSLTSKVIVSSNLDTAVVGVYQVTYSVADAAGNTVSDSRTIHVMDRTKPTIALNGESEMYVEIFNPFNEPSVLANDNYDNALVVVTTGSVDINKLGTYTIEYCVTDMFGNGPVCVQRKVTVGDTTLPVITLNGSDKITVEVFKNYTDAGYTANDNNPTGLTVTQSGNWNGPTTLGSFTITYTAVDASGNSASVSRTIEVVDTEAPVLSLLGNAVDTVERWVNYIDPSYNLSDNYYKASELTVVTDGNFVNTTSTGVYYISYQVSDPSGNMSEVATRVVVVVPPLGNKIDENSNDGFSVYPNPSNGQFVMSMNLSTEERVKIQVFSLEGKMVYSEPELAIQTGTITLDLSSLSAGTYILKMNGEVTNSFSKIAIVK